MNTPILILAGGGHARVLIDALQRQSANLLGVLDPDPALIGQSILGVPVLGGDEALTTFAPDRVVLVNGIGSTRSGHRRSDPFLRFKKMGYRFANVIHPSAIVAGDVVLGEGSQIMAGAVIQTGCCIGANAIINTGATIDHDCNIGDHAHIAPGATLSGGVAIGANSHVGAGATIIQGIRVGRDSLVAAGAVVIRDVPEGVTVAGVPAKVIEE